MGHALEKLAFLHLGLLKLNLVIFDTFTGFHNSYEFI